MHGYPLASICIDVVGSVPVRATGILRITTTESSIRLLPLRRPRSITPAITPAAPKMISRGHHSPRSDNPRPQWS